MPANTVTESSKSLQAIAPDRYVAGATNGPSLAIAGYRKAKVILQTRLIDATATLDVKVQFSIDSAVTFNDLLGDDALTVVAFAQLLAADDNVVRVGLLYLTELPLNTTHIRLVSTFGTADGECGAIVELLEPIKAPVVRDNVAQASGGNAFYAIHGLGAR